MFTGSSLKNICTYQKLVSTNGMIYLHRPLFYDDIPSTCECTIEASKRNATLTVSAIDVRLQPKHVYDTNLTGHCPENSTINLTFREGNVSSSSYECSNETIFAEYTTLYSSRGNVLNLSYTEGEVEPQKVWILITGLILFIFSLLSNRLVEFIFIYNYTVYSYFWNLLYTVASGLHFISFWKKKSFFPISSCFYCFFVSCLIKYIGVFYNNSNLFSIYSK